MGLIAEEVNEIQPLLVGLDQKGDPESVHYNDLIPVLLKAVQDQKQEIDNLKQQIKN